MQVRPNYVVRLVGHKAGHRVSSVSLDRLAQQSRHHLQSIELISRICYFIVHFLFHTSSPFLKIMSNAIFVWAFSWVRLAGIDETYTNSGNVHA